MNASRPLAAVLLASSVFLAACGAPVTPPADTDTDTQSSEMPAQDERVRVTSPAADAEVSSPLTVTGEARGPWFFEASFPVKLYDDQGDEIATGTAQAQGDWMTEDFVPFQATLTFTTASQTGILVLEKDNPSGEPQNAASVVIPVVFAQ